jgi:putative tricarboxylic transport membrane protein
METLQHLLVGFGVALTPTNLGVAAFGALVGTIVGMLPGLGPINGVAILMPLAFALKLPPETALILLAAVYMGCEFGGRISSILLNVPGDAGAIMTALDGTRWRARAWRGVALSISAWAPRSSARWSPPSASCCLHRCWRAGRWRSGRPSTLR